MSQPAAIVVILTRAGIGVVQSRLFAARRRHVNDWCRRRGFALQLFCRIIGASLRHFGHCLSLDLKAASLRGSTPIFCVVSRLLVFETRARIKMSARMHSRERVSAHRQLREPPTGKIIGGSSRKREHRRLSCAGGVKFRLVMSARRRR